MAGLKIYNGSSWVKARAKVYDGSNWKGYAQYYDGSLWVPLESMEPPVEVYLPSTITADNDDFGNTVYSGFKFQSDGGIIEMGPGSTDESSVYAGSWHVDEPSSTGADYDIRCALINLGTWTNSPASTGTWVNLGSDRFWRRSISSIFSPSIEVTNADFEIRDASTLQVLAQFTVIVIAEN